MSVIRRVKVPLPAFKPERQGVNVFITIVGRPRLLPKPQVWKGKPAFAVKDNITTHGSPTTCASGILQSHQSPFSAEVVYRLENGDQPAIVMGKTNMDEFGMGSHSINSFFGAVRNSGHFDQYSVGGSSGGSAVAVANDRCVAALGTDTGGSVRLPAAYTGVVGFKPSYGRVSRWGVIPYANSLDTVGFLASTALLTSLVYETVNHFDPKDPTSMTETSRQRIEYHRKLDLEREWERMLRSGQANNVKRKLDSSNRSFFTNKKIGVPLEYNISELEPRIRDAWQKALQLLQDNGATIVPISLPNTKHALSAYYVLAPAEAASNLSKYDGVRYGTRSDSRDGAGDVLYSNTRGCGFGDEVKRRILLGSYTLSSEAINNHFIKAQKVRRLVQRDFDRVFAISNPLRPAEQFDLSNMDESVKLDDKLGPTQVDFIVCPTAPTIPPRQQMVSEQSLIDTYMNDVFTVPASLAGLPAISIPWPISDEHTINGRPNFAGIQIMGQYFDDQRVLVLAIELQKLTAAINAKPRKKPLIKIFDWGSIKHSMSSKPKKMISGAPVKARKTRLKKTRLKATQRHARAVEMIMVNATPLEAAEVQKRSAEGNIEDASLMQEAVQPGEGPFEVGSVEKENKGKEQEKNLKRELEKEPEREQDEDEEPKTRNDKESDQGYSD